MAFDARPTICPLCGEKVLYGRRTDFGITPFQSGYCYYCSGCGGYVGTHRKNPKDALGTISKGSTRMLRVLCHKEFDKHYYTFTGKNQAYYRLSKDLGIDFHDCHFGHMDEQMLRKSLNIMKGWGNLCFR
jgi:hypothetical protein